MHNSDMQPTHAATIRYPGQKKEAHHFDLLLHDGVVYTLEEWDKELRPDTFQLAEDEETIELCNPGSWGRCYITIERVG